MRLKQGHYLRGPEPLGCFNSGVAPTIARSKQALKYTGKAYMVGKDIDITLNTTTTILNRMKGVKQKVKFFATEAAAMREFEAQCKVMIAGIKTEQAHVKELRAKAAGGDMAAIMALNDY